MLSGAQNAANKRRCKRLCSADLKAAGDEISGVTQFCLGIVADCDQLFASFYAIADAFVEFQPHSMIDFVFFLAAPTLQHRQRRSKISASCRFNVARLAASN